jgi:hypothetical protein
MHVGTLPSIEAVDGEAEGAGKVGMVGTNPMLLADYQPPGNSRVE